MATDDNGCPASHPIGANPRWRPAKPTDLTSVNTVSACRYELAGPITGGLAGLLSSARLTGPAAARAIRGVLKAPVGGGPDVPGNCAADVAYGEEAIVLLLNSTAGRSEIVIRYSGCDHHGFDDGVAVRTLTAEAVAPFLTGGNGVINSISSPELAEILGR